MVDPDELRRLVHYDPETGRFTWAVQRRGVRLGEECGRINLHGYRELGFGGKLHRAHRLAFVYMTGAWPEQSVDHINGDKLDNRWANLREASTSQNMANVGRQANNTSGSPGVVWDKDRKKWRAQICIGTRKKNLGRFSTKEEAERAYRAAAKLAWGVFAR